MKSLLRLIANEQSPDGSFASVSFSDDKNFSDARTTETTFHASLVLCALGNNSEDASVKDIARKAGGFLHSQKSSGRSWNYWAKNSADTKRMPCPDDWDDTSCAISALALHGKKFTEAELVSVVNHLVTCEVLVGGPYFTWLVPENLRAAWNDCDAVVNANILRMLGIYGIELATMDAFLEKIISEKNFSSKYYPPLAIAYFIAHAYRGKKCAELLAHVIKNKKTLVKNPLDRALFITSVLNLGAETKSVAKELAMLKKITLRQILPCRFYIQEISKGIPTWSGSRALTAACMIEAITLFEMKKQEEQKQEAALRAASCSEKIGTLALKRFAQSPELKPAAEQLVRGLAKKDPSHEIAFIATWFAESLSRNDFSKKFLDELGAINTLGWIGYTITDKVLDGEDRKNLLPLANVCIREVSVSFEKIFANDAESRKIISDILDGIDRTNFWEHHACKLDYYEGSKSDRARGALIRKAARSPGLPSAATRSEQCATGDGTDLRKIPTELPDYKNNLRLAEKSLGHALGPIALMLKSQTRARLAHAKLVQEFFTHYIIARQLNDDAHDWQDDLNQGFLNSASAELLRDVKRKKIPTISLKKGTIDLATDLEYLQKIFWETTIDEIVKQIYHHTNLARKTLGRLASLGVLTSVEKLNSLLTPLEKSADQAIRERDQTKKFLRAYQND